MNKVNIWYCPGNLVSTVNAAMALASPTWAEQELVPVPKEYNPKIPGFEMYDNSWWVGCSPTLEQADEICMFQADLGTIHVPVGYVKNRLFFQAVNAAKDWVSLDEEISSVYRKYSIIDPYLPMDDEERTKWLVDEYVAGTSLSLVEQSQVSNLYEEALRSLRENSIIDLSVCRQDSRQVYLDQLKKVKEIITRNVTYALGLRLVNVPQEYWPIAERLLRLSEKRKRTILFEINQVGKIYRVCGYQGVSPEIDKVLCREDFIPHDGDYS